MINEAQFTQFAKKYRRKFQRIAAATRRELEPDEVMHEAWLLARMWAEEGTSACFDDQAYVDKLFAHLYQGLVRYTDKKVRTAVRLDHWAYGDNPETDSHPLLNKLAADEASQPLEALLELEAFTNKPSESGLHDTRASAYLHLLRLYDNCMKNVASHLLISLSYCYYRLNEAAELASRQCAFSDTLGKSEGCFTPGPWRSFRLSRPWLQMELDLMPPVDLFAEGVTECAK